MRLIIGLVCAAALGVSSWFAYRWWTPDLVLSPPRVHLPAPTFENGGLRIEAPSDAALGQVATFHDELLAYLNFEYVRSLPTVDETRVFLTSTEVSGGPVYRILIEVSRDLLKAVPYLAELQASGFISSFEVGFVSWKTLRYLQQQTALFDAAYHLPVRRKLETLQPAQLLSPMARFILFKSKTDRRIRKRLEPAPTPLSLSEAHRMAADIIAVAHFYSLPLDFFLGIGAMENNYMNMPGDLEHTVWRRRPRPGDVVVRWRKGRALVLDYSIGVWQITVETLRYAHKLYLKDDRDYSQLPARLRPPQKLDLDSFSPDVLTTYAGLLFRHLLDHFNGNVEQAVAAYNGGKYHPNEQYAEGVSRIADYARKVLEEAAALNGRVVAKTKFIVAARPPAPLQNSEPVRK